MDERRNLMSGEEMKRYRVIQNIIDGFLSQIEGAKKLGLSIRQTRRLQKRVTTEGAKGVVHRLVGRLSNNRIAPETEEKIKSLWVNKYKEADFNFTHFTQKLNEVEGIKVSIEKVRQILRENNLTDRKKQKRRKHRKERPRKERFGEMLQQDTSPHDWLGTGEKLNLVAIIDDATSQPLFAKFYKHDGTLPNFEALDFVFRQYGLPMTVYTDRASWFHYSEQGVPRVTHKSNREELAEEKKFLPQISRALEELGVEHLAAYSPQAKGRIERMNRTFQDRLISELRLRNIKNIELANQFIFESYLPDHTKRFAVPAQSEQNAFVKLLDPTALDNTLCLKYVSTTRADNVISKKGLYKLQLLPTKERISWAKAKVEVRIHLNNDITVVHNKTRQKIPYKVIEQGSIKEYKYGTKRGNVNGSN